MSYILNCVSLVIQIYGIDAASGAAVSALNLSEGDHVLDLCAAPGNMFSSCLLLYIALVNFVGPIRIVSEILSCSPKHNTM